MPDAAFHAADLDKGFEQVKAGPTRETWLIRLLGLALVIILLLVPLAGVFALRIDGRAQRTVDALDAAAERDAAAIEREQAQARALEAFRQLVVATTPEERAAARAELEAATIPAAPTTPWRSTTTTSRRSTTTTRPPTTTTTAPAEPAPSTSTSTTAPNPQPQPQPDPAPCVALLIATICPGGSP